MELSELNTILLIEKIIALVVIFQSLELIQIRQTFADQGVWQWGIIKKEFEIFPGYLQSILDFLLKYPNFLYLLYVRLVAGIFILFLPQNILIIFLLITTVLISIRWRGTFNGGSDYLTIIILLALSINTLCGNFEGVRLGCLWYIAIQTCSSYFIAGLVKLKKPNWRNGSALKGFLETTIYQPVSVLQLISKNQSILLLASWIIIFFECSYPMVFFKPDICLAVIGLSIMFHLVNFYIFGLNRFLLTWSAAYPALYFCSQLSWQ